MVGWIARADWGHGCDGMDAPVAPSHGRKLAGENICPLTTGVNPQNRAGHMTWPRVSAHFRSQPPRHIR